MGPKKDGRGSNSDKKEKKKAGKSTKSPNGSKKSKANTEPSTSAANSKDQSDSSRKSADSMKMTIHTAPTMVPRSPVKRPGRPPGGKKPTVARPFPGKIRPVRRSLDNSICDNSNDSGLGFDNGDGYAMPVVHDRMPISPKRQRLDLKHEDDINDNYAFPDHIRTGRMQNMTALIRTAPSSSLLPLSVDTVQGPSVAQAAPRTVALVSHTSTNATPTLATQLTQSSKYGDISLNIICQPEQQHRARYQTEGSRGAVKDRTGNGFPMVKLNGYNKQVPLQVFIGTDTGKVAPHMFYQACRVCGKNSTPCHERKIDGTVVIEMQLEPSKDMTATCDCVGILKERNVDVEHRFPDQQGSRSKKKSTRCRMVFRVTITHDDNTQETLQVCSQPIICTQPPGIPEISKKSLTSCPASGGLDLFVIGKNFSKDTKVYFQQVESDRILWEKFIAPDKEYLNTMHFTCIIPPYQNPNIAEPVTVRLFVVASGKTSEIQQFVYTPVNGAVPSVPTQINHAPSTSTAPFLWSSLSKQEQDVDMMPPPGTCMVPLSQRRSSTNINTDSNSPPLRGLKQEILDENTQSSILDPSELRSTRYRHISESSLDVHPGDSNMSMINDNSIDMLRPNNMNENSNLSIVNENSVEMMVRRNSMSRVCESSLDVNISNSNMSFKSSIHEDSSCSNMTHHVDGGMFAAQGGLLTTVQNQLTTVQNQLPNVPNQLPNVQNHLSGVQNQLSSVQNQLSNVPNQLPNVPNQLPNVPNQLPSVQNQLPNVQTQLPNVQNQVPSVQGQLAGVNVEDLKGMDLRKIPMGTVADLVNTNAPSLATLQSFGVTEASNNPLPAQSAISVETYLTTIENKNRDHIVTQNVFAPKLSEVIVTQAINAGILSSNAQNTRLGASPPHVMPIEPSYIATQRPMVNVHQSNVLSMVAKSEAAALAEQRMAEPSITTTVSTITSCEGGILTSITTEKLDAIVNCALESHISPNGKLVRDDSPQNNVISQQDVMLTSQNPMMVSPIINTANLQQSPTTITPEIILNTQISPSLMCRNTNLIQDGLGSICSTAADNGIIPAQNIEMISPSALQRAVQSEKDIILSATVDLLATQKKIYNGANGLIEENQFTAPTTQAETIATSDIDKRNEDRMIPPSFPSMSDNDLINIINPTCFDQGNNFH